MLSGELQQLDQLTRAVLKQQTELHKQRTRLEAARDASYMTVSSQARIACHHACARAGLGTPAWPGKEVYHQFLPLRVSPPATGPQVLDISKRFPAALSKHVGTVVIHTGMNDISSRQSEALNEHFRLLLDTVKKRTKARVIISGPLPTCRRGSEVFRRLYALHCWLQGWCKNNSIGYVSNWSASCRPAFYRRNGLDPSHCGSVILSGNIEKVLDQA
ncbi:hypothetical protein AOLI_G00053470 [Acnodon oligacanthus]